MIPVNRPRDLARALRSLGAALGVVVMVAGCANAGALATPTPTPTPTPVMVETVTQAPIGNRDTAYSPARPAPALRLTDQDGRPFDLESLHGNPVFVYFGYTHCPDVCPTTLADIRAGIKEAAVEARVVFVTIDPARDDAAAMKQYLDYYQAGYIGLTGSAEQIAQTARAWGVSYRQLPSESANGYAMAHSTDTFLIDADGMLRHHIFFGAGADLIAVRLHDVTGG